MPIWAWWHLYLDRQDENCMALPNNHDTECSEQLVSGFGTIRHQVILFWRQSDDAHISPDI